MKLESKAHPITGLRRRRAFSYSALAGLLAATLILSACSSSVPAESDNSTGQSGTLRFGMTVQLNNWEPLFQDNSVYSSMVYEGLVTMAPDGVTVVPKLATEWEESPTDLTLTLREGVKFHDGTPFDTDAAVKNLERFFTTDGSPFETLVDSGTTVEALPDNKVRINLPTPAPSLLINLARSRAFVIAPSALDAGTWKESPVGTGPYVYSPTDSTSGSVTVGNYFPDYYAPEEVHPERVELYYISDGASIFNALQADQVDVGYVFASIADQARSAGFEISTFPANLVHLQMYDTASTFEDKRVRQAICYAMDTSEYREALYGGEGDDYYQRFQEGTEGYSADVKGYPHDLDKAKSLMAEAGNPEVSFSLINYDSLKPIVEVFRSQMAEIGVTVNPELPTYAQFATAYLSGEYPASLFSDSLTSSSQDYYSYHFASDGPGNPYNIEYPAIDQFASEASLAESPAEQAEIWQEMTSYVNDEALDCGFYDNTYFWAYNPDVVSEPVSTRYVPGVFNYGSAVIG